MPPTRKEKTKICLISLLGYPLYNKKYKDELFGGGAGIQLYFLSKEFARNKKFDVNVITGDYQSTSNKLETVNNIKLHIIRPIIRKPTYYLWSLINFFIVLIKINPDVIIQRATDKITGLCALYCKIFKKKFIYSIACITDVDGTDERGIFGKFYKYGLRGANLLVAQNKEQVIELERYKQRKFNNISVINNSYEILNSIIKEKNHILWVARAINWKRPELFIQLAENFPNEKFVMICNITDKKIENVKYWKSIVNKASNIPNLKFIEFVPFHKIDQYFKKAKIFVNTSIYEGFPNTFIQAFINKTPVISLNVNPNNFLKEYKVGFFCENKFSNMIKNLKRLLEDEQLYKSYADNCLKYVIEQHNIKKNVNEWMKLI